MARLTYDGVPAKALAERWGVPQCGVFRKLPTTLDAVHDLADQGAPHGTLILADEQTTGRGRQGKVWHSPKGGLWMGFLARPEQAQAGAVSLRLGLAVAEAVDAVVAQPAVLLKWPNDLMVQDRKLGGLLCEGRWQGDRLQWLAIGIGINVANEIPQPVAGRAIALSELVPDLRRIDLLDQLMPAVLRVAGTGGPLTEAETEAWARRDWLRGRQIRTPVFGIVRGIRPDGALLVDTGGRTTLVREGHVELA